MKSILKIFIISLSMITVLNAQELQKNYINYQAVAADASGNVIADTSINLQLALKFGAATNTASYIENHTLTTNSNGLFSLLIGNGNTVAGDYNALIWGNEAAYITVSLNGAEVGTTELVAVPFALSSGDNQWEVLGNDIQNKNTGKLSVANDLEVGNNLQLQTGIAINEFSIDGTLTGNSDTAVPTEKAVKTYVDNITTNSIIGINDLLDGKTTSNSIFLGDNAGAQASISDALTSVGVGNNALSSTVFGIGNTAIGHSALNSNTASRNTAIGADALSGNISGFGNVALGFNAGRLETGSNRLYISNSSTSDPLIYGEFNNQFLRLNGTVEAQSPTTNPTGIDLILGGTSNDAVGDNGVISFDPDYTSSDIFMLSNDDVFIHLDNNDENETSQFAIRSGDNTTVLAVNGNGNSVFDGEIQRPSTGNANLVPIAYGTINEDGTIINGTGNFTASLNTAIFEILVDGEDLTTANTVCSITPRSLQPRTASFEFSASNGLFVITYDSDNNVITPTDFQFVIYKL